MGYQYVFGSPPASPWSVLLYAATFIKYNIIPLFLRFALYAVLQAAKSKYHTFHRAMVLRGEQTHENWIVCACGCAVETNLAEASVMMKVPSWMFGCVTSAAVVRIKAGSRGRRSCAAIITRPHHSTSWRIDTSWSAIGFRKSSGFEGKILKDDSLLRPGIAGCASAL